MSIKQTYIEGMKRAFEATPFASWLEAESVSVFEGFAVEDVRELDLHPWPRIGGRAAFINLYAFMEAGNGVYVAEIPPGGKLEPERWCCQKIILIEGGTGTTEIWQEGDTRKHVFEWGKGSVFAIPINAWHRMYNVGREPAKFLALTKAPLVMRGFGSPDFVFNCSHPLRELYSVKDQQFFAETSDRRASANSRIWETNFIRDAWGADLDDSSKAYGGALSGFRMANKTFGGHIAEWAVGRYHQAHYHDSGRLVHPLRSEGFVMCWSNQLGPRPFQNGNGDEVVIEPFKAGGLYSPPGNWYHAHFNTGTEPARHLAFYGRSGFEELTPGRAEAAIDSLINYPDEDPEVRHIYEEVLAKKGIAFDMPDSVFERTEPVGATVN